MASTQGSTDKTIDRAGSTAHDAIARATQTASQYAERFGEKADEWLEMKDTWVEGTREYVRAIQIVPASTRMIAAARCAPR